MNTIESLIEKLVENLNDTRTVKKISDTFEEIIENKAFRLHAHSISTDPNLTSTQKKTQILYLVRSLDVIQIYDFFDKYLNEDNLWLFIQDRVDHLDLFVRQLQIATDKMKVVELITAIPLDTSDLSTMAQDLSAALNVKVLIEHEVNPALLGGAKIHVGNLAYDFSLRNKFQQFQQQWLTTLHQTGKFTGRYE